MSVTKLLPFGDHKKKCDGSDLEENGRTDMNGAKIC